MIRWIVSAFLRFSNWFRAIPSDAEMRQKLQEIRSRQSHNWTQATGGGCCTIVFNTGRADYSADNVTDDECQELARETGGVAQKVTPGSRCI